MPNQVRDLLAGASSLTMTAASPAGPTVTLPKPYARQFSLMYTIAGTAGDGGDSCIPVLQTSLDGGLTWLDVAAGSSVAGGTVAAVTKYIEALTEANSVTTSTSAFDATIAADTIRATYLGPLVRLKGKISETGLTTASWSVTEARLAWY